MLIYASKIAFKKLSNMSSEYTRVFYTILPKSLNHLINPNSVNLCLQGRLSRTGNICFCISILVASDLCAWSDDFNYLFMTPKLWR